MTLITALPDPAQYHVRHAEHYDSAFAVSPLAAASLAAVGQTLGALMQAQNLLARAPEVVVDQRLASLWYGYSLRPSGWQMPDLWDPIAGNYETADGWIRLHTNLPHHRNAALSVLSCANNRAAVAQAVRSWSGDALETDVVAAGGVAAAMRSRADWQAHPQGMAVAAEPLIRWAHDRNIRLRPRPAASTSRPLAGLRILDLTRVLAGPIATRTLAGLGAEVLRIDPPGWDEPGVIPDISLGKRCSYLDLTHADDRSRFEDLLSSADVLVHGYRPGALDGLGYDLARRDALAPNRIEVTLDAYGWTGPWARRRGFDSLVQMSAGIADAGRIRAGSDKPVPLPVQALDHATGYLMAAAVLSALTAAQDTGRTSIGHLSLARTAELLASLPVTTGNTPLSEITQGDYAIAVEPTGWGPGHRLAAPLTLGATTLRWDLPAPRLGTSTAAWV